MRNVLMKTEGPTDAIGNHQHLVGKKKLGRVRSLQQQAATKPSLDLVAAFGRWNAVLPRRPLILHPEREIAQERRKRDGLVIVVEHRH